MMLIIFEEIDKTKNTYRPYSIDSNAKQIYLIIAAAMR